MAEDLKRFIFEERANYRRFSSNIDSIIAKVTKFLLLPNNDLLQQFEDYVFFFLSFFPPYTLPSSNYGTPPAICRNN
jgi:hypothetical protein